MKSWTRIAAVGLAGFLAACGGGGGGGGDDDDDEGGSVPGTSQALLVFAGNDLGMHCLNPSYDKDVILPPYNNLWAQVVQRGNPPAVNPAGFRVFYEMVNNTHSYGKGSFGQFWDNMKTLFGVEQPNNIGLTGNGLSGEMVRTGDHFEATGVPVTPVDDNGVKNPYQVAKITVKDAQGSVVATTQCTVPTSDEFNCGKCHKSAASPTAPEGAYLAVHDRDQGTSLVAKTSPFLCADAANGCHVSPALGQVGQPGDSYLSAAIHGFHGALAANKPACYDCHPGQEAKCNRSLRHTAADGDCTNAKCHGDLSNVAATIAAGRVPWVGEPKCASCHDGATIPEVDTGTTRYRDAVGHGGMRCTACHGSPHAMFPSQLALDNYQPLQYQDKALSIGSCAVCHRSSRGAGASEFGEVHGGANPEERSACHVCHTAVSATTTKWPHAYKWAGR